MWNQDGQPSMTPGQPGQAQQPAPQRTTRPWSDTTSGATGATSGARSSSGEADERDRSPEAQHALDALTADDDAYAALTQHDSTAATPLTEAMRRAQARALIREFLRAAPRSEEGATLALTRPNGEVRLFTRAQLSAAIDHLRPRQRQIVRLGIEERWPRQKVCEYLRGISMKTLERDQVEALDILAQL